MMIKYTKEFLHSVESINDEKLSAIIAQRIRRMREGNLGDTRSMMVYPKYGFIMDLVIDCILPFGTKK